jgi:DNA-binding transcriptional ArsR family regulator
MCLYIQVDVSAEHPAADPFRAVAAPIRRQILDLLAQGEHTVTQLCAAVGASQPLQVLRAAGLMTVRKAGKFRHYALRPAALREIYDWVRHYEHFWDDKFAALGAYLDRDDTQ